MMEGGLAHLLELRAACTVSSSYAKMTIRLG